MLGRPGSRRGGRLLARRGGRVQLVQEGSHPRTLQHLARGRQALRALLLPHAAAGLDLLGRHSGGRERSAGGEGYTATAVALPSPFPSVVSVSLSVAAPPVSVSLSPMFVWKNLVSVSLFG